MANLQRGEQDHEEPDPLTAALPYVVPYGVFAVLTTLAQYLPDWKTALYAVKVLAVGGCLWAYRRQYSEVRVRFTPGIFPAVLVGLAVIAVWIGLDRYYPQSGSEWRAFFGGVRVFEHPEKMETGFNPFDAAQIMPPLLAIAFRLLGAVLLVPIFEELTFRSWLLRQSIKLDFKSVPIGTFTWLSFVLTAVVFGLTHREWLAGILCGLAFNGLMCRRKDIFLCMVAHATANLALGVWVLARSAWGFW